MDDISAHIAGKLIAYAAAHGAQAARAMAKPWGLTTAQVDTFCRENSVAIKRQRLVQAGTTAKGHRRGIP